MSKKWKSSWAKVYYTDLWGTKANKFARLEADNLTFTELILDQKMAYFVPFGSNSKGIYDKGISIAELFSKNITVIVSGNDTAAIAPTRDELTRRPEIVKNASEEKTIYNLWGRFSRGQTAKKYKMTHCQMG